MTDKIVVLPGVERRDLAGDPVPSEQVLQAAILNDVTDVVVIGKRRDGELYVAAASSDGDRVAGILMRAVTWLVTHTIIRTPEDADE